MLTATTVGPGPISSAPRPTPRACEQLPVPAIGTCMQEMTKMAAPTSATSVV